MGRRQREMCVRERPVFGLAARPGRSGDAAGIAGAAWRAPTRPRPRRSLLSEAEAEAHVSFVTTLGEDAIWVKGG